MGPLTTASSCIACRGTPKKSVMKYSIALDRLCFPKQRIGMKSLFRDIHLSIERLIKSSGYGRLSQYSKLLS